MKYVVHVERVVRLRRYTEFTLGPYWFRWVARFVAWSYTQCSDNVWMSAEVREVK